MNQRLSLSQRGIVHLLAIIIGLGLLAVLAFSLNALFASRSQQQPQVARPPEVERQSNGDIAEQPSPRPTIVTSKTDPTAGWNIYTNPNERYSIKYPNNWYVYPSEDTNESTRFASYESPGKSGQVGGHPSLPREGYWFSIALLEKQRLPGESLKDYIANLTGRSGSLLVNPEEVRIMGLEKNEAVKVEADYALGAYGVFVENGKDVYVIWLPFDNLETHQATVDMMLSTLRFIE